MAVRYRLGCLVLLVGVVAGGLAPQPAAAGWWDDLDRGESVRLSDVIAQPARFRGRVLSFFCIFHRRDQVFAPLAAPFNPQRHENFAVWPDGAPVWEQSAYKKDYPFLYIERSHPQYGQLVQLELFTRIEVTGRVRGSIRARPCIEVAGFRATGHRVGSLVVKSIMAGDRYSEMGRDELAYENYRRALRPDLPPSYDLLVRKRLAEGLRRLGRLSEAAAVEGGEILGGSGPPEAQPGRSGSLLGDPLPQPGGLGSPPAGPAPAGPAPLTQDDLPGIPSSAPSPVTHDLPGSPVSPCEAPPSAFPPANAPPPIVPPPPVIGPDLTPATAPRPLPTAGATPFTGAHDLPGTPVSNAPAGAARTTPPMPPPSPRPTPPQTPPHTLPQTPAASHHVPPSSAAPGGLPSGAPRRHVPRLSGVK